MAMMMNTWKLVFCGQLNINEHKTVHVKERTHAFTGSVLLMEWIHIGAWQLFFWSWKKKNVTFCS